MTKSLRNCLLSTAALLAVVTAQSAKAGVSDLYARLDSGFSIGTITSHSGQTEKVGNSMILGGTVGYQLGNLVPGLSVELGVSYRGFYKYESTVNTLNAASSLPLPVGTTVKADTSALTIMPQVVYRLPMVPMVTPYVAAGVGYSNNTTGDGTVTLPNAIPLSTYDPRLAGTPYAITGGKVKGASNGTVGYTLGLGAELSVLPMVHVQLGYRFLSLGAFKTASSSPLTPTFSADVPDAVKQKFNEAVAKETYDDRKPVAHEIAVGVGYRF
ncbi:MAG: outer membrane beta-barrel protein [Alphaproteobacteria bacterium]|nr:outer membrane beta-barrel protein [Alphaproteobacteria bacterium]